VDSAFFKTQQKCERDECTNSFAYVGRFLFGFAQIESHLDALIKTIFSLEHLTWVLTIVLLDLRKKIQFIEFGCKHQNQPQGSLFGLINELHDIRNMLVHSRFRPDYGNADHNSGQGIEFDFVALRSKSGIPKFATEGAFFASFVPYADFDGYDRKMAEICAKLERLSETLKPISSVNADMARDISAIIEPSGNIVPFPTTQ
jgi:hypothetical protein